MSTRSVVGDAIKGVGRYVHWDGYPKSVGKNLHILIKRDGAEAAIETLSKYDWSYIDPSVSKDDKSRVGIIIEGYGEAYDDGNDMTQSFDNQEYGYAIYPDGIVDIYAQGYKIGSENAYDDDFVDKINYDLKEYWK